MNRPIHFEIHAFDPEKLATFYTSVFGWKMQRLERIPYWLIDTGAGDGINGGLMKRLGAPPVGGEPINAFVCSLGVESVDVSLKKALAAGATMARSKMAIPGVGWQAYIKDPDGNILGLHQADKGAK